MLSKTKIALSAAMILSTALSASAATNLTSATSSVGRSSTWSQTPMSLAALQRRSVLRFQTGSALHRNANAASNFAVTVLLLAAAGRRLRRRAGGCFDRKRFPALAAVTGFSLPVLSSAAEAADQCPQKNSPIDTDRPDVTNSSVVLPQGSFQDETA